jgi:hypothetical protein
MQRILGAGFDLVVFAALDMAAGAVAKLRKLGGFVLVAGVFTVMVIIACMLEALCSQNGMTMLQQRCSVAHRRHDVPKSVPPKRRKSDAREAPRRAAHSA